MAMNQSIPIKDVGGRIADRLTILLGLNGLLVEGAFGELNDRQKRAMIELLETTHELRQFLEPMIHQP
jgi:hypothetical protein